MHVIKNVVVFFMVIFANNVSSMDQIQKKIHSVCPMTMQVINSQQLNQEILKKNYFIYEQDTNNGILVDPFVAKKFKAINSFINDCGDETNAIPLKAPIDTIQLIFSIAANPQVAHNMPLKDLINVANHFDYLEVHHDIFTAVLRQVTKVVTKKSEPLLMNETLSRLHSNVQKTLMIDPTINYLKNLIIKEYGKNRQQQLVGHPNDVRSTALSEDGNRMVSGCNGGQNNLIVWNLTDLNTITHQVLVGHPDSVCSTALSDDGNRMVSGCWGSQNNLIIWDLTNLNTITHQVLVSHPYSVCSTALSNDGNRMVSGCWGSQNNLIVWDLTDLNTITHHVLVGHPNSVYAVALSDDGNKMVSGCWGSQNNLIVWNLTDLNTITHHVLVGHPNSVYAVALSNDGNRMVSGCNDSQNNLIVWDLTDLNTITHQVLVGHPNNVYAVALSDDGNRMVSSCNGSQNNLIVWDLTDLNTITHQVLVGNSESVYAVALSDDGNRMVSGCNSSQNNLIVWDLTDQEQLRLNQLKDCNADQARLIYLLCLQASKNKSIAFNKDSSEKALFMTLPKDMQELLNNLLLPKSWQKIKIV